MLLRLFQRAASRWRSAEDDPAVALLDEESGPADSTDALVRQMLAEGRYALLLRPQIAATLPAEHLAAAQAALEDGAILIPEGAVLMQARDATEESHAAPGRVMRVEAAYLDRFAVTNRQYAQFVRSGGYEQMPLWDSEVWAALVDFVDQTDQPGPLFWRDGRYARGQDNHPVVGVCWYEAAAYARWAGKRLPTDPEWVKAAAWPVSAGEALPLQRRFPWGDMADRRRANLWSLPTQETLPVDACPDGESIGGARQLVGNVWEWTSAGFGIWDGESRYDAGNMKSLRGGAFDTYFDGQANCHFQSGDSPLARKRNIGFRCAVGVCDLAPSEICG